MKNGRSSSNWLTIGLLLVVMLGVGLYLRANPGLLAAAQRLSWPMFGLLVLLRLLFLALNGLILQRFVSRFGVQLLWQEWLGLALVTTLGNYITPFSGGMLARATYLKQRHNLLYAQFASLLAASYFITFGVSAILGLGALFWLGKVEGGSLFLLIFFTAVLLAVLIAVWLPVRWLPAGNGRFVGSVRTMLEGWERLRSDRALVLQLAVLGVMSMLLNGLAFWFAYQALGFGQVSFPAALLVSLSSVFSIILTITPGNIGLREALVSLTSELLAIGVGEGLLVALLIRVGTLSSVFTLGPLFSVWLSRQLTLSRSEDR